MEQLDLSHLADAGTLFHYINVLPRHATFCSFNMKRCVNKQEIITNRGRKKRTIYAPNRTLRWVQQNVRSGLLDLIPRDDAVHGFVKGRGCLSNATAHIGAKLIVNIDLKDFFPSITPGRVHGLFRRLFNLGTKPATMLTRVTTFDDHLCQGFLTSPDIANLLCWKLDQRLKGLAEKWALSYTRYADDLTFSSKESGGDAMRLVRVVTKIVEDEGLRVNPDKIAIMRRGRRQKVTGLVVSEHGVNIPRRIRRKLRAACHHWPQQTPERKAAIGGWIAYINSVSPAYAQQLREAIKKADLEADTRTWTKDAPQQAFDLDINTPPSLHHHQLKREEEKL